MPVPAPALVQHADGKLFDGIPDWSRAVQAVARKSGRWSDPSVWGGVLPGPTDDVLIPTRVAVTADGLTGRARILCVKGELLFDRAAPVTLTAHTVLVLPGGRLELGTPAEPLAHRARLVLGGPRLSEELDPNQHGGGLLVLGEWTAGGAAKTGFARSPASVPSGATTLSLAAPVSGWKPGDTLVLPDTRSPARRVFEKSVASHTERATVQSVAPGGKLVTLTTPARFSHLGNGGFFPHIGNLSRSVTVESADGKNRAHTLVGESARADLSGVGLVGLGRTRIDALNPKTNHIGRYALHFHHANGPFAGIDGYRSRVVGCAVDGSDKWGIVVHGTTRTLISGNVVAGAKGAAFVTEDGNEGWNEFVGNLAVSCVGSGEREPGLRADKEDIGSEGVGFWLASSRDLVKGNVAADCALSGFLTFRRPERAKPLKFPLAPEARPTDFVSLQFPEWDGLLLDAPYVGNESYGCYRGQEIWGVSPFTVRDFSAWNCHIGFVPFHAQHLTLDGLTVRGDVGAQTGSEEPTMGVSNRYYPVAPRLKNLNVSGVAIGLKMQTPSGEQGTGESVRFFDALVENSRFTACPVGIRVEADLHYKKFSQGGSRTVLRDCRFEGVSTAVQSVLEFDNDQNPTAGDALWVENFQGRVGESFRLWYDLQSPSTLVPQASPENGKPDSNPEADSRMYFDGKKHFRIVGLPEAGMTNRQAWTKYKKAWAGGVAPETAKKRLLLGGLAERVSSVPPVRESPWKLEGDVLSLDARGLSGWLQVANELHVKPPLTVTVDGMAIGAIRITGYLSDNQRRCVYRFAFPKNLQDGVEHDVSVTLPDKKEAPGWPRRVRL